MVYFYSFIPLLFGSLIYFADSSINSNYKIPICDQSFICENYNNLLNNTSSNVEIVPIFKHNFCESRLQNNKGPELWNAYTALAITIIPIVSGFPRNPLFYNVACMLSCNGIASFYYHYYLSWFGKQTDEMSMILANYFGLWGLIDIYYNKNTYSNQLNRFNTLFMYLFLASNTIIQYDYLFPSIFGIYVGFSIIMIHKIAQKYNVPYKRYLFVSFIGFACWMISEYNCNENTVYGHTVWHILFPLGFYRLLKNYDEF